MREETQGHNVPNRGVGLGSATQPQSESQRVLRLMTSGVPSLRRRGIAEVADLLNGGPYNAVGLFREEQILRRRATREVGKRVAQDAFSVMHPEIFTAHAALFDAWLDGGPEEEWFLRVLQNNWTITQLEAYHPGTAAELTERFGIKNFYRFSVDHWIRQYDERNLLVKPHVPIFMSTLDERGKHEDTARLIEVFEGEHTDSLSIRIYEWEEGPELRGELTESALRYGPAERNLLIITHGNYLGLSAGMGSSGKILYSDLESNGLPDAIRAATGQNAAAALVACQAGSQLDYKIALEDGTDSFAERLTNLSERVVIASRDEIRLERIELDDPTNPDSGIVPVFLAVALNDTTRGQRFLPRSLFRS